MFWVLLHLIKGTINSQEANVCLSLGNSWLGFVTSVDERNMLFLSNSKLKKPK